MKEKGHRACLMVMVLLCWVPGSYEEAEPLSFTLNPRRATHILDDHFISININPTDLLQGKPFGIGNNSTVSILRGLAPAYVRLGSHDTNRYAFKNTKNVDEVHPTSDFIVSEEHWKNINELFRNAGLDVVVCLNSALRTGQSDKWDPRNALQLITYSDKQQYNITWELGYEPLRATDTTGTQLGKDISQLRAILNAFPRYQQSQIIGPDVRALHRKEDVDYALDVLMEAGPAINAVTWHPRWPHASAITPSDASDEGYEFPPDYLEWDRNQLHKLLQRALLKKPFWISEPKAENLGSFAEGLIYARRLSLAAKLGIDVVMKQPCLNDISHPKPEYWVALLHKRTLGRTVLDARPVSNISEVSMVVQCTSNSYGWGTDGGLTVFAVNTAGVEQKLIVRGIPQTKIGDQVHQYILSAGQDPTAIFSQMTYLNNEPLLMTENGQLPELAPKIKRMGPNLMTKLPPYSIGYWVLPHTKVKMCQQEPQNLVAMTLDELNAANVIRTTQKGINSIRNMTHIIVSKLLGPITNEEGRVDKIRTSEENPSKRFRRMASPVDLDTLRNRVEEINDIMNSELERERGNSHQRSESEENSLRVAESKINGLATDLTKVIKGVDQEKEFGDFLQASGLNQDFGKLMMEDRQARKTSKGQDSKSGQRNKRQITSATLKLQEDHNDLAEIEKRFRRIIAKHKKNDFNLKKIPHLNLDKINKEFQEDLLVKEITLLEKTEEALAEVMKIHQEKHEAVEELLHDEIEQMKEEKLATLMEIKKDSFTNDENAFFQLNNLKNALMKEGEKLAPIKRETGDNNDTKPPKEEPFSAIRSYLNKRRETLQQRQKPLTSIIVKAPLQEPVEVKSKITEPDIETTTAARPELITAPDNDKRRSDVLKYMTKYLEQINVGKTEKPNRTSAVTVNRKPRKRLEGKGKINLEEDWDSKEEHLELNKQNLGEIKTFQAPGKSTNEQLITPEAITDNSGKNKPFHKRSDSGAVFPETYDESDTGKSTLPSTEGRKYHVKASEPEEIEGNVPSVDNLKANAYSETPILEQFGRKEAGAIEPFGKETIPFLPQQPPEVANSKQPKHQNEPNPQSDIPNPDTKASSFPHYQLESTGSINEQKHITDPNKQLSNKEEFKSNSETPDINGKEERFVYDQHNRKSSGDYAEGIGQNTDGKILGKQNEGKIDIGKSESRSSDDRIIIEIPKGTEELPISEPEQSNRKTTQIAKIQAIHEDKSAPEQYNAKSDQKEIIRKTGVNLSSEVHSEHSHPQHAIIDQLLNKADIQPRTIAKSVIEGQSELGHSSNEPGFQQLVAEKSEKLAESTVNVSKGKPSDEIKFPIKKSERVGNPEERAAINQGASDNEQPNIKAILEQPEGSDNKAAREPTQQFILEIANEQHPTEKSIRTAIEPKPEDKHVTEKSAKQPTSQKPPEQSVGLANEKSSAARSTEATTTSKSNTDRTVPQHPASETHPSAKISEFSKQLTNKQKINHFREGRRPKLENPDRTAKEKPKTSMGSETSEGSQQKNDSEPITTTPAHPSKSARSKRDTDSAQKTSGGSSTDGIGLSTDGETSISNSILKEPTKPPVRPDNPEMKKSDLATLVLKEVIPTVYNKTKEAIINLHLPEYLHNFEKIIENIKSVDTIIKDVASPVKAKTEHIQKIDRNKRDIEEFIYGTVTEGTSTQGKEFTSQTSSEKEADTKNTAAESITAPFVQKMENDLVEILVNETAQENKNINSESLKQVSQNEKEENTTFLAKNQNEKVLETSVTESIAAPFLKMENDLAQILANETVLDNVLENMAEEIVRNETIHHATQSEVRENQPIIPEREENTILISTTTENIEIQEKSTINDENLHQKDGKITIEENKSATFPSDVPTEKVQKIRKIKKHKHKHEDEEGDDPVSPRLEVEQNIIQEIIKSLLNKRTEHKQIEQSSLKEKRNGFKREIGKHGQESYPIIPKDGDPTEVFKKLRPGVYVVPSKDMANVHAEQISRAAIATKQGKNMPNVLSLNIYYDKKQDDETSNNMADEDGGYFKQGSQFWTRQEETQPYRPQFYPPPIQAPPPAISQPFVPNPLQNIYNQPYQMPAAPINPYGILQPPVMRSDPYLVNQPKRYNPNYYYDEPKQRKVPEMIPVTTFSTWSKYKLNNRKNPKDWQLSEEEDEKYSSEEKQESHQKNEEHSFPSDNDKKKLIEPFWNRTLGDIFEETAKDPFWKILQHPPKESVENTESEGVESSEKLDIKSEKSEEEGLQKSRRKRSITNNMDMFDISPFEKGWKEIPKDFFKSLITNNLMNSNLERNNKMIESNSIEKQRVPHNYLLDTNRIFHKKAPRKVFEKTFDLNGSLKSGKEITNFQLVSPQILVTPNAQQISTPEFIVTASNPKPNQDRASDPFQQFYDMAVELVKSIMTSSDY